MKGRILFYDISNPGHLPLVQGVFERGYLPVLNNLDLARQARAAGLAVEDWRIENSPDLQARVEREMRRIVTGLSQALNQPELRQALLSPELGDFLPHTGQAFVNQLLSFLASEIAFLERLDTFFEQAEPCLIVLHADNHHLQRALVLYAAQCGIPSLLLAHALDTPPPPVKLAGEVHTVYADYVAVYGERARANLIAKGNAPERIFVTGAPLWDPLYVEAAQLDAVQARQQLGLAADRPVLLVCTSYTEGSSAAYTHLTHGLYSMHQAILRAVRDFPLPLQLVVRPHPNEMLRNPLPAQEQAWLDAAYQEWLARQGVASARLLRGDKVAAIRAADVVLVTGQSSLIAEAMILQRPVVTLEHDLSAQPTFTAEDGIIALHDWSQLRGTLEHVLSDAQARAAIVERQNKRLPELNHANDGRATQRLVELIEHLANASLEKRYKAVTFLAGTRDAQSASVSQARRQPSEPLVSIIIPVLDRLDLTAACLKAVQDTTPAGVTEIIVVDNGSHTRTRSYLCQQAMAGSIRLIVNDHNEGFGRACNRAALAARGNYLLFLNNDTEPTPGWLEAMLSSAQDNEVAAVGAKLLYPDGRVQHAGVVFRPDKVPHHVHRFANSDAPEANQQGPAEAVTAACMLIRRALFLEMGGFDEVYRNGYEDVDLCLRLRAWGRRIVYQPQAVVYHHESQSAGRIDEDDQNYRIFTARWAACISPEGRAAVPQASQLPIAERSIVLERQVSARTAARAPTTTFDTRPTPETPASSQELTSIQVAQTAVVSGAPPVSPERAYKRRVAVDARTFAFADSVSRGIGHYTYYHILHLAQCLPDWEFIMLLEDEQVSEQLQRLLRLPNVRAMPLDDYRTEDFDLVHIPDPMTVVGMDSPMRLFAGQRATVTFYDLIPLRLYWNSWDPASQQGYLRRLQQLREQPFVVLAISEHTRQDLMREGIPGERIKTVMAGLNRPDQLGTSANTPASLSEAERTARLRQLGITQPFFLHVGAVDPHKNFDSVLKCFVQCRRERPIQLVVAGRETPEIKRYADYCTQNGVSGVVFTGFVSRTDLELLYQEAIALLFLSRYEGFGLPVLEAMANSCPVITTRVTSIPEVAGEAALLFDPDDHAGIVQAMLGLLERPEQRRVLRDKGLAQAARFTWQQVAERTIAVWEDLLDQPRPSPPADTTLPLRRQLGAQLGRRLPISLRELEAAGAALSALLSAPDLATHVAAHAQEFDPVFMALLDVNRQTAEQDGNQELAELLGELRQMLERLVTPVNETFAKTEQPDQRRPPVIAVDVRSLAHPQSAQHGIARYTHHHLRSIALLRPDWQFALLVEPGQETAGLNELLQLPNMQLLSLDDYQTGDLDLVHIPNPLHLVGFDSPLRLFRNHKGTAIVYDLLPLRKYWDVSDDIAKRGFLARMAQLRSASSFTILAISEFMRQEMLLEGLPAERLQVILAGMDPASEANLPRLLDSQAGLPEPSAQARLQALGISRPFFLHVGALDPHVSFDLAARAFLRCHERRSAQLIVAADPNPNTKAYAEYCAQHKVPDISFLYHITRADLDLLYSQAVALLCVSNYEGFPFGVLEAMARGCPVIASRSTSIPEVTGDAALLCEPGNEPEIAQAMVRLLDNPTEGQMLRRRGLERAASFTWRAVAEKTIAVWETLLNIRPAQEPEKAQVVSSSLPPAEQPTRPRTSTAVARPARIPIAMPTYNRADYLRQVLAALRECDNLDRFMIVTSEEPDCPEVSALFDAVDFVPIQRHTHPVRWGLSRNVTSAINLAFEQNDVAVILEDDIVPAKDFLSYVLWGLERFRDDPCVISICGYRRLETAPDPADIRRATLRHWFAPWGWATWKDRWQRFYREVYQETDNPSWDNQFCHGYMLKDERRVEVVPLIGRTQNIGEIGTWVPSPEWQRQHQQTPFWHANSNLPAVPPDDFVLVDAP